HTSLVRRTYETDIACGFGLAARRFAAMARAGLAGRRSYAACWLARRKDHPPSDIDIAQLFPLLASVHSRQCCDHAVAGCRVEQEAHELNHHKTKNDNPERCQL